MYFLKSRVKRFNCLKIKYIETARVEKGAKEVITNYNKISNIYMYVCIYITTVTSHVTNFSRLFGY